MAFGGNPTPVCRLQNFNPTKLLLQLLEHFRNVRAHLLHGTYHHFVVSHILLAHAIHQYHWFRLAGELQSQSRLELHLIKALHDGNQTTLSLDVGVLDTNGKVEFIVQYLCVFIYSLEARLCAVQLTDIAKGEQTSSHVVNFGGR